MRPRVAPRSTRSNPIPLSHDLLVRNVAANPTLAPRMRLFHHGIGRARRGCGPLCEGARRLRRIAAPNDRTRLADPGKPAATIQLRDAAEVLREIGIDSRTLLKIDIEGAEYQVLPAIAPLLAEASPGCTCRFIRSI